MARIEGVSAYHAALLEARRTGFAGAKGADEAVLAAFRRMLSDIARDASTAAIDPARAEILRRQVTALLGTFEAEFARATEKGISSTLERIVTLHDKATADLFQRNGVGGTLATGISYTAIEPRVYASLAAIRKAPTFRSLLTHRIKENVLPEVDALLTSAVTRGVASGRASLDLARLLAEGNPRMEEALRKLPRTFGTGIDKVRLGAKDFARYGIDPADVPSIRRLLYDSRRIARSESANTMRETNAIAMTDSPVVLAGKWQLSGRHAGLPSSPDDCDYWAEADLYGYGPGYYPPEKWPLGPHSHCGCYQGGPMRFVSPDRWGEPKPGAPPLRRRPGQDPLLASLAERGGWSEKRLASVTRNLDGISVAVDTKFTTLRKRFAGATGEAVRRGVARAAETAAEAAAVAARTPFHAMLASSGEEFRHLVDTGEGISRRSQVPYMRRLGRAMDAEASGYASKVNTRRWYGLHTWEGEVKINRDVSAYMVRFDEIRKSERFRDGSLAEMVDWAEDVLKREAVGETFGLGRGGAFSFADLSTARAIRDGIMGHKVLVHEFQHHLSDTAPWDYVTLQGKWIEEGLVEYRARMYVSQTLLGGEYEELVERGSRLAREALTSYRAETDSFRWYRRRFGIEGVEELFNVETGAVGIYKRAGATAARGKIMLDRQLGYTRELVNRIEMPDTWRTRFRRALDEIDGRRATLGRRRETMDAVEMIRQHPKYDQIERHLERGEHDDARFLLKVILENLVGGV